MSSTHGSLNSLRVQETLFTKRDSLYTSTSVRITCVSTTKNQKHSVSFSTCVKQFITSILRLRKLSLRGRRNFSSKATCPSGVVVPSVALETRSRSWTYRATWCVINLLPLLTCSQKSHLSAKTRKKSFASSQINACGRFNAFQAIMAVSWGITSRIWARICATSSIP